MMKEIKNSLFVSAFLFGISFSSLGQVFPGSPTINAGQDYSIDCTESCVDLEAHPFHVGETDTYIVESIPYTPPVDYDEPGGTPVSVGTDDVWSPTINLPFTFCFYGDNYTTAKIGSNGAIKMGTNSASSHPWMFSASVPSPSLVAAGNIFGPYHDVQPGTWAGGTVKWYLLGTAPSRIFAVVFNELPHYSDYYCPGSKSSFMMVLYETTNAIDVYIKRKDLCTNWNDGYAVIGIQNNTGTEGITPPGRNTGTWTVPESNPEAWRFVPNGAPIYTVEWTDPDGNIVGNGVNATVCPEEPTVYTVTATYAPCDGGTEIVVSDDVLVQPNPNPPVVNPVVIDTDYDNVSCHGLDDGSITINASVGQTPYTYFLNGEEQNTNVFTDLPPGTYYATVVDDSGCVRTDTIIIEDPGEIGLIGTAHNVNCHGANDGYITTNHTGGTPDFTYSINGSEPQEEDVFNDLGPGEYQIVITDANGCQDSITKIITEPDPPSSGITTTQTIYCAEGTVQIETEGVANGSFSATPEGLTISSLNGTINLDNSVPGTYDVVYSFSENGCQYTDTLTITVVGFPDIGMEDYIVLCEGEYWTPNASGVDNLVWSDGLVNGEPVQGQLGTYTYTVSGVTEEGCEVEKVITVVTYPNPTADFTATPLEGAPPLNVTFENNSSGADSYEWIFGDGSEDNTDDLIFSHLYVNDGTYHAFLIATTDEGCSDTAVVTINVIFPDMIYEVPNVFTPNGDGDNDVFIIKAPENIAALNIVILNRWGNLVYESNEIVFGWNGKIKNIGAECEDGVYFYKMELTNLYGDVKTEHGYVHLNRGK